MRGKIRRQDDKMVRKDGKKDRGRIDKTERWKDRRTMDIETFYFLSQTERQGQKKLKYRKIDLERQIERQNERKTKRKTERLNVKKQFKKTKEKTKN